MSIKEIIIPSKEEIIEFNKKTGADILNENNLDFIFAKINALNKNYSKKQVAFISAIIWYEINILHPFIDGNKRAAIGTVKYFLNSNGFLLGLTTAGEVSLSLDIINGKISFD